MGKYRYVLTGMPGPVIQRPEKLQEIFFQFDSGDWSSIRPQAKDYNDRLTTLLYLYMRFPEEMESAPWQNV